METPAIDTPPTVSVIMPVRDVAPYIAAAVESALSQTMYDLEVIVIDDESSDETPCILERYEDPRLRVVRQACGSCAAARNAGRSLARAPFIAFLDGDDVWLPRKLERQLIWLQRHPEADAVFTASRMIDVNAEDAGRAVVQWSGPISFEQLLVEDRVGNGSSTLIRRSVLDALDWCDNSLPAGTDHDLWLRIALRDPEGMQGMPEALTLYRRRPGQITGDWRRKERTWRPLFEKMQALAPERTAVVAGKANANALRVCSSIAMESGDARAAGALLLKALRFAPGFLLCDTRTWLLGGAILASRFMPSRLYASVERSARRLRSRLQASAGR